MSMQGGLTIEQMCEIGRVSRASFYRSLKETMPVEEDMEVRSEVQKIVLEHRRRYGYRRVTAELRRRGMVVNHKRVARIMREDNLLAMQPRAFVLTTDSNHKLDAFRIGYSVCWRAHDDSFNTMMDQERARGIANVR
jgi:transposase InsO family protein